VTSVAYPVEPQLPGWIHSSVSLVVGWFLGAAALFLLYGVGRVVGAISQPYGSHPGTLNEWPYGDNGAWSTFANSAVIAIALVLTTVATSWWLRRRHPQVSDGRLAFALLFSGWIPLAVNRPAGGLFGFCLAVVLIRYWIGKHDDRLSLPVAAILVAILGSLVLSYGLLHPLWTVNVVPTASAAKTRRFEMTVHNAARAGVTIDRVSAAPFFVSAEPSRLHLASGADGFVALSLPRGDGCGTLRLGVSTRYRVFGLTLRQQLPVNVPFGPRC
jgi:hypothetical protein